MRADLRSLSKPNAEIVGAHLAAAGQFLDDDPRRALDHARAARARAARIGAVREAVGIAAYHAQQWAEALSELRAARRITGDPRNLAVMADTERALGRPAQALRMLDDPDVARLDAETRAELLIVVAGARRDLGQVDAALGVLARGGLDPQQPRPGSVRLWYAYADALGRRAHGGRGAAGSPPSAGLDTKGRRTPPNGPPSCSDGRGAAHSSTNSARQSTTEFAVHKPVSPPHFRSADIATIST